jgi:hypothetical protein
MVSRVRGMESSYNGSLSDYPSTIQMCIRFDQQQIVYSTIDVQTGFYSPIEQHNISILIVIDLVVVRLNLFLE